MTALVAIVEGWLGPKFADFAKPLVWLAAALLFVATAYITVKVHDHRVVSTHDARQDAANSKADKKADDNSADQRLADAQRMQAEKTQTQEAIDEAKRNGTNPRAAYYDCVRKQQSARRAGQPSPKC